MTIVVATASYYLVERPFLKLKMLWSKPRLQTNAYYSSLEKRESSSRAKSSLIA